MIHDFILHYFIVWKNILKSWFRKHKSNSLSPNEKRLKSYIMIMVMGIISIWILRGRWFLHSCEFQSKQKIILQSHYILFHKIDKLPIVNLFTNKMRFCLSWCILFLCYLMFLKSLNEMVSNYCLEILQPIFFILISIIVIFFILFLPYQLISKFFNWISQL